MIIWLASWPRSGNTLVRTFLQQVFGINSYAVYREELLCRQFGLASWAVSQYIKRHKAEALAWFGKRPEAIILKTHQLPDHPESATVIYVVRDGRAACASTAAFYQMPMRMAIRGRWALNDEGQIKRAGFGSWSEHYRAWSPGAHGHCCLLRFEDILAGPEGTARKLADFLGVEPQRAWENPIDRQREQHPRMFAGVGGTWPDVFTDEDTELFWGLHGDVMAELGYGKDAEDGEEGGKPA